MRFALKITLALGLAAGLSSAALAQEAMDSKRLPPKEPRSAIYAVMLFDEYPDWTRPTGPMSGVFKALALVGKALRFEL